ncbi:hypothetical protein N9L83_01460 [Flavobacteriales bacterium]|nr:hypothetical protein [Flavobacteriales bacterium]
MNRFLKRTGSVFILLITTLWLTPVNPSVRDSYLGLYRTHSIKSKTKVQFVGASNLAFGILSSELEANGIQFQSYGFHGGLGPQYHLNQIPNQNEGVIIFSPPPQWLSETKPGQELAQVLSTYDHFFVIEIMTAYGFSHWAVSRAYNLNRFWWDLKQQMSPSISQTLPKNKTFSYSQEIVNSQGVIKNEQRPLTSGTEYACFVPGSLDTNFWKKNAGKVDFILIPPLAPCSSADVSAIQRAYEQLAQALSAKLLFDAEFCLMSNSDFSDTNLHLTDEGAKKYSSILASKLRNALQQP